MADEDPVESVLLRTRRLTDVISRVPFNLRAALRSRDGATLIAVARECESCTIPDACEAWIAANAEGEGHAPPEFCPNAEYLKSVKPDSD